MIKRLLTASAAVALLALPAHAASISNAPAPAVVVAQATAPDAGTPGTQRPDMRGEAGASAAMTGGETFITSETAYAFSANDLIGRDVKGTGDEDVGTVDDLLLDQNGQIKGLVIASGGFLGLGEKQVAVAWEAITVAPGDDEVRVSLSQEDIAEAPDYESRR